MAALLISLFVAGVIIVVHVIQHGESREMLGAFLNISAERAEPELIPKRPAKRLSQEDRTGILRAWRTIQARFERDPKAAIIYADLLITDLLGDGSSSQNRSAKRDFDKGAINDRYQSAHAIAKPGSARIISFSEIERAMELYCSLFEDLLLESARDADSLRECGRRSEEITHA
jgi:hypothetical protein